MITDPILSDLNPPQQEAVQHGDGPLLILAGAGSGKTRVITRRIAYLIARRELRPWQILAVTFTNKAADEMKKRVEQHSGCARSATSRWGRFTPLVSASCGTWHAELGFRQSFVIYDDEDQLSVIKDCLKGLNLSERALSPPGSRGADQPSQERNADSGRVRRDGDGSSRKSGRRKSTACIRSA